MRLEWTGQEFFVSQPLREWFIDGKPAGLTRGYGPLQFATLFGAGHMVCNHCRIADYSVVCSNSSYRG